MNQPNRRRVMLVSDVHLCHIDWYGMRCEDRLERMIAHLCEEYERDPYEMILFLGDYSLDFWVWDIQGSYINQRVSRTQEFVERFASRLPSPWMMIPGNHEQYSEEKWREITGQSRRGCWATDGWLFILLDSFAADLDPSVHSDGTFTPIDVDFVRAKMAEYPDHRVILCAHHFDFDRETDAGRELVRDKRIACLFSGHVHMSDIVVLPPELGGKRIIRTGQYSYTHADPVSDSMWGFREVILTGDSLTTRYITPENTVCIEGQEITVPYGTQDEFSMLATKRLILRRIEKDDWKGLQKIWSDFNASPYAQYDSPHPTDEAHLRELTARWAGTHQSVQHMFFAVCLDGDMIGFISCHSFGCSHEISYGFLSEHHGKGYAKESLSALFAHLRSLGITRFSAGTALKNLPSVRLLTSLGFALTATERVSFYKDAEGSPIFFDGGVFDLSLNP